MVTEDELYERIFDLESKNRELEDIIIEQKAEIEYLEDKLREIQQDVEDNYKKIPLSELYDMYDKNFI